MSAPSSEGRPSISSLPSAASSHTLNSRNSGAYQYNREGSSSPRRSLSIPGHNSRVEHDTSSRPSSSQSPLSVEAIEEQDFAHRKQRNRRSGGFLLDSSFGGGSRSRQSHHGAYVADANGNRIPHHRHAQERDSRSSPLSHEIRADHSVADSRHRVVAPNMHGQANSGIQILKRRSAHGIHSFAHENDAESAPTAPQVTIDPNHIVHMALNLSESRRRNLASGQLLGPQPRVSSAAGLDGSFHSHGTGGGLRQYLNDQRRDSRAVSPDVRASSARHMSSSVQRSGTLYIQGREITDATLARRDKVRAYFELRLEYLRLLDFLPPLKPDSTEPGNFIITANNVPGSPHALLTRMPSYAGRRYELGRQYNPLQCLRNRRLRARERKALEHPPEEFADIDQVRDWVDRVESEARYPHYRQTDGVLLPKFHEDHECVSAPVQSSRPHILWMFTSEELLADAHWLELGDHKTMIEDRHGTKLFVQRDPQKQDLLHARSSKEYSEKRGRNWNEGSPADPATGDESETVSDRGRKRRLLPTFRAESPKHKKHGRIRSMDHYTDSSDSDSDAGRHRQRRPNLLDSNRDTAPLELTLKQLIEQEAEEAQLMSNSPAMFTPDTPDKWGRQHADGIESVRNSLDVPESSDGSVRPKMDLGLKLPPKIRADASSMDPSKEGRSSFEYSTAPSSPLHRRHFLHTGSDLSPPLSRTGSLKRKSKKSKLDIFRSDEYNKHIHNDEQTSVPEPASSGKGPSSRQVSEEAEDGTGIGAAIWAAPGAVKNLLSHRKNDSVNSLSSPIKEPHSAVTRFLKGVKHEGSKVQEFIFRKDRPLDESDTEGSEHDMTPDTDIDTEAAKEERRHRPDFARITTAESMGSTASQKTGRYHLELPSFRPTHQQKIDEDAGYPTDPYLSDHVTRQARERANSRSSRFDQLAPPPMDLSRISSKESTNQDRITRVLARPGGVGQGGLPITPLAQGNGKRKASRPKLNGRHWSITDENGNVIHRTITSTVVKSADIARVRALFLCSGVKARELGNKVNQIRPNPPAFLKRAAETANAQLYPVSKKEEHVLAARILVNNIESTTSTLEVSATKFRDEIVKELTTSITTLKDRIESDLFPRVRNSGDGAVVITSQVSGDAPLTVKQVSDEIDRMLTFRRRRMRWVRRVGWTMVEWMLLGVMWFAWLTVTVCGAFGRVFGFFWGILRWMLWL